MFVCPDPPAVGLPRPGHEEHIVLMVQLKKDAAEPLTAEQRARVDEANAAFLARAGAPPARNADYPADGARAR